MMRLRHYFFLTYCALTCPAGSVIAYKLSREVNRNFEESNAFYHGYNILNGLAGFIAAPFITPLWLYMEYKK